MVILRVLKSPISLSWKWSHPKKLYTDLGMMSRNSLRQLGCHEKGGGHKESTSPSQSGDMT